MHGSQSDMIRFVRRHIPKPMSDELCLSEYSEHHPCPRPSAVPLVIKHFCQSLLKYKVLTNSTFRGNSQVSASPKTIIATPMSKQPLTTSQRSRRTRCTPCLGKSDNKHYEKNLPWKAFRTLCLPLVVACSSAARSGKPCPPLDLRACCMSPERPF